MTVQSSNSESAWWGCFISWKSFAQVRRMRAEVTDLQLYAPAGSVLQLELYRLIGPQTANMLRRELPRPPRCASARRAAARGSVP